MLQGIDVGITVQDRSGRLVFANQTAAELVGCANPDELLRASPADLMQRFVLFDERGAPFSAGDLPGRALLEGRAAKEHVIRFRVQTSGIERWSSVRANAVRNAQGQLELVVNVFRDVTTERLKDDELRLSHEWFSTALRSIGDAVVATDREGRVNFLNPVAEALTGWSLAEAKEQPLREVFNIINEATRERVASPVELVLERGQIVGLANHTILVRKDGVEVAIDDSAAPIRDGLGGMVGVVLVFRDVSAKRKEEERRAFLARAAQELNSSLDYQRTLATVARLAVPTIADWCAVDLIEDGKLERLAVAHVDPAKIEFVRQLEARYPSDPNGPTGVPNILRTGQPEMMSEIPRELLIAAAKDAEHAHLIEQLGIRSYVGVPIRRGERTIGAITLVNAESNRLYQKDDLEVALALADRAAVAIENARLFRELERARADAELANRSKDEFLAILGHELRNPLAPILTAVEVMELQAPETLARERTIIERQVRHMVRLVDDLLDVSRITRGKIDLKRERLELADVVAKALELASPLFVQRAHEVKVDVPSGRLVVGDEVRLAQVVANLLNNAAKYTPRRGHIEVSSEARDGLVILRVRDNGVGISPEMLPRIFDLFVQESQSSDRAQGGLGLGLAIVRNLVTLHGGTVSAKSAGRGLGSEIEVALPALKEAAEPARSGAEPTRASIDRGRVLIVDDNVDALELLSLALQMKGYQVTTAADGPAALSVAEEARPSIALLDIGLPVMDGYELGRRLRALPGLEQLKLVAVTGYGQPSDRARSAEAGFDGHLVKPITLAAVQKVLEKLV